MILEYAQLLSTAHRVLDGKQYIDSSSGRKIKRWSLDDSREPALYKATHINHPSAVWVRQSKANYDWLYVMWRELIREYKYRYYKTHACEKLIKPLTRVPYSIFDTAFTPPPPAMPDHCKVQNDSIASYRKYYIVEKSRFATWKERLIPEWYIEGLNNANISISK
jgi:hypothetical protein